MDLKYNQMIILLRQGNIGNQLFEYAYVKKIFPNSSLLLIGFEQLLTAFDGVLCDNNKYPRIVRLLGMMGVARIPRINRRLCLFDSLSEEDRELVSAGEFKLRSRKGLLHSPAIIYDSFFQAELSVSSLPSTPLSIKPFYLLRAQQAIPSNLLNNSLYFVCIRRGDYVFWPSKENPAVLPLSFYKQNIQLIRDRDPDANFLLVSDDPSYVYDVFTEPYIFYFNGGFAETLAAMTLCSGGGIMSASSFCWWGGLLCKNSNPDAYFIAAKYWIGHSLNTWFPPNIYTSWIDYREVVHDTTIHTFSCNPINS